MINTKLSIIVPTYNEEQVISNFLQNCLNLGSKFSEIEILVINDGSSDRTRYIVEEFSKQNSNVILINLAKNFGHMPALTAGFKYATGEWIATVDADGQDDPKLILEMYKKCIDGSADICFTRRMSRRQDSLIHRFFSPLFYKVINRATNGDSIYQSADFRLISRRVQITLNMLPEVSRMYRVLIPALGFKSVILDYERNSRHSGKSKYNFRSLLNLGIKSVLATTGAPLRWISLCSLFGAFFALAISTLALFQGIFYNSVPGWASISFVMSIMFFLQSITSLVISEFLLILIADVRQRPTYQLTK